MRLETGLARQRAWVGTAGPRPRFRAGAEGLGGWRVPHADLVPLLPLGGQEKRGL